LHDSLLVGVLAALWVGLGFGLRTDLTRSSVTIASWAGECP